MKLPKNIDRLLLCVTAFILTFVFSFEVLRGNNSKTYAENDGDLIVASAEHFVTFYDEGEKLTVKTNAATVKEALARAGINVNEMDKVDPGLETEISGDIYVNIYRSRPVLIRDGTKEKYVMTASYDAKTIAREAGLVIYDGDEVAVLRNTNFLETGVASLYEITRNGGRTITVEEEIPFEDEIIKDYDLAPGVQEVRELGEVGLKVLTYEAFYEDNVEVRRDLVSETVAREPVRRVIAVGASEIERHPLTAGMGRNRYTIRRDDGSVIERQETYYDLNMSGVMVFCGADGYSVREDGVKVDADGYVLVAANLSRYPRCSVVETSLGLGKVYDTGAFAAVNPEQFDLATDWTNRDGK